MAGPAGRKGRGVRCASLGPILGESNVTFIYPDNGRFEGNIDMSLLHLWSL